MTHLYPDGPARWLPIAACTLLLSGSIATAATVECPTIASGGVATSGGVIICVGQPLVGMSAGADAAEMGIVLCFGFNGPPPVLGDLDHDGDVDGADLGLLLGSWGEAGGEADLDGNGLVDGGDLGLLLGNWGE